MSINIITSTLGSEPTGYNFQRKILKCTTGRLVLISGLGTTSPQGLCYNTSDDNGDTWNGWIQIYSNTTAGSNDAFIDANNNIYIAFTYTGGIKFVKLTYNAEPQTWSVGTSVIVDNNMSGLPSICQRSNGDLFISGKYYANNKYLDYAISTNGGVSWTGNHSIQINASYSIVSAICFPYSTKIRIIINVQGGTNNITEWEYDTGVSSIGNVGTASASSGNYIGFLKISDSEYYTAGRTSSGIKIFKNSSQTWDEGTLLSNNTTDNYPTIASVNGNPVCIWQDYDGSYYNIYYRKWNGTSWDSEVTITSDSAVDKFPTTCISDTTYLYTAWSTGTTNSWTIYYEAISLVIPPDTYTKTVSAKARAKNTNTQTVSAKAKIYGTATYTKTVSAKSRVKYSSVTKTVSAKAKIEYEVTKTVSAKAKILIPYNGKFIQDTYAYIITDTFPAKLIKIDLTNPTSYTVETITGLNNGKNLVINHDTGYLYATLNHGYVSKILLSDPTIRTNEYLGEDRQLNRITHNEDYLITYAGDNIVDDSLFILDESTTTVINTSFGMRKETNELIETSFGTLKGAKINTEFGMRKTTFSQINTLLGFLKSEYDEIIPLTRTDFHVFIGGIELGDDDLILSSIRINLVADNKANAFFELARKHDDINNPATITNNNIVTIYIGTPPNDRLMFTGRINNLDCRSSEEKIGVSAEATDIPDSINYDFSTKDLPLTVLNTQIHLYDVLLNNIIIDKPYLNSNMVIVSGTGYYWTGTTWSKKLSEALTFVTTSLATAYIIANSGNTIFISKQRIVEEYEHNPKYYQGIKINKGSETTEKIIQFWVYASGISTAEKIEEGTFEFLPGWTYFWWVTGQRYDISGSAGSQFSGWYIGTSLAPLSGDFYEIESIAYVFQKEFSNEERELGYYLIGSAPYKEVSTKNGAYIAATKWVDKEDGFYLERAEGYSYNSYIDKVGVIEFEKIKNINGDILPKTSATIELTLDGYLYYGLKLLTRLNLTNTIDIQGNIYKANNGFPLAIKQISIDASSMKVSLSCDNEKSEYELGLLDDSYPLAEYAIIPGVSRKQYAKYDLPSEQEISY